MRKIFVATLGLLIGGLVWAQPRPGVAPGFRNGPFGMPQPAPVQMAARPHPGAHRGHPGLHPGPNHPGRPGSHAGGRHHHPGHNQPFFFASWMQSGLPGVNNGYMPPYSYNPLPSDLGNGYGSSYGGGGYGSSYGGGGYGSSYGGGGGSNGYGGQAGQEEAEPAPQPTRFMNSVLPDIPAYTRRVPVNVLTLAGVPNTNGSLHWPIAFHIMRNQDQVEVLLTQINAQFLSAIAQEAIQNEAESRVREALRASLDQLRRTLMANEPYVGHHPYLDAVAFLRRLDEAEQLLEAEPPAAPKKSTNLYGEP